MPHHDTVQGLTALSDLLDQALELPPAARERWIDSLPPDHDAIRPRLRRLLLDSDSSGASFLQTLPRIDADNWTESDDPESAEPPPEKVGPYSVVRKLSEGGMGTVWLARRTDAMVNRSIALKLPRGGWWSARLAERLTQEREILATLSHPNIARLYDAGIAENGQPYLALEYVTGRPIDQFVAARQLSIRQRLELFLQVARAVAHAHARLIVHRDLKPSNILVTDEGEVKLLDFGIAKLLDDPRQAGVARAESTAQHFTPDYASPEQIAGEPLGTATDVYSSGVILYELLTGTRPYTLRDASPAALQEAILQAEPRRPSTAAAAPAHRRLLRGDLDTIVLKALKKRPEDRYATIDALAEDIDRYLHDHPVLARPDGGWYRVSKFVARNTMAVSAATAVLVAVLAGSGLAAWQAHVAVTEKEHAEEVSDFLITLFRDASPYNARAADASALDWLRGVKARIGQRLEDRPALRVRFLNAMGYSFLTMQDTDAAEDLLVEARDEGVRRLGENDPQTLRARVLMTQVHLIRDRLDEARAEFDRLAAFLRPREDVLAEDLVLALKNQAYLEQEGGRYEVAEALTQEAVDIGMRRLGREHPETVGALLARAYVYQYSRGPASALEAAERAYRMAAVVYADFPRHPRIIEGQMVYGRALGDAGEAARSAEHLAQAVSDAAAVFGASSRMVGLFSLPLARYQIETGRISEALAISERAITILAQDMGPEAFHHAVAIHHRGASLLAARRAAEAEPDLRHAAVAMRRHLGPSNWITRWFEADWAIALARTGRHRPAVQLIEAQLSVRPPSPSAETMARYTMGVLRRLSGDAGAALRIQRAALASAPPGRGTDLLRMRILTETGLALLDLDEPREAARSLEQALMLSRQEQTHASPERADILVGLGRANVARGPAAAACPLLLEADIFWRGFDSGSSEAREAARWLARCN
jgi:serine/threonine-protein kinase